MTLRVDIEKSLPHFTLCTQLSCNPGELTALVGPSGSGKTTLIRIIAGLERPDRGEVELGGAVWEDGEGRHLPTHKRAIGLVFQDYPLFPHLSVLGNIVFGSDDPKFANDLMDRFGILHLAAHRPANISGGERQRAAFCQALARKPRLLLLDEPFSALDVATRTLLSSMLAVLKTDLAIPIVHVTHDLAEAHFLADHVVALEKGRMAPDWLSRHFTHSPIGANGAPSYS